MVLFVFLFPARDYRYSNVQSPAPGHSSAVYMNNAQQVDPHGQQPLTGYDQYQAVQSNYSGPQMSTQASLVGPPPQPGLPVPNLASFRNAQTNTNPLPVPGFNFSDSAQTRQPTHGSSLSSLIAPPLGPAPETLRTN